MGQHRIYPVLHFVNFLLARALRAEFIGNTIQPLDSLLQPIQQRRFFPNQHTGTSTGHSGLKRPSL
ncbi:protein of unknown function [Pararobbsia alpina]